MAEASTFLVWAESLDELSYYDVLRVAPNASAEDIQTAFHALALRCHPDRFVDEGPDVAQAATRVFKRAVEAYNVLRRPDHRIRYDADLHAGRLRLDLQSRPEETGPQIVVRTLEMVANDPQAKKLAAQADRLIAIGRIDEARVKLTSATQNDPFNDELKERLTELWTMTSDE